MTDTTGKAAKGCDLVLFLVRRPSSMRVLQKTVLEMREMRDASCTAVERAEVSFSFLGELAEEDSFSTLDSGQHSHREHSRINKN